MLKQLIDRYLQTPMVAHDPEDVMFMARLLEQKEFRDMLAKPEQKQDERPGTR